MIQVRTTQGLKKVTAISLRNTQGLKNVTAIDLRTAQGLVRVFTAGGSASASILTPASVDGSGYSRTAIPVTTDQATVAAPSGATITWQFADAGWTAVSPSNATTAFRKTCAPGAVFNTTVTATYTVNGVATVSNSIAASVANNYEGDNGALQ